MMTLVIGTPDSGKSVLAEKLAMELSDGEEKIYIATMVPFGEEGQARVQKHRNMRSGKGFKTVECPRNLQEIDGLTGCTCLLECMSNLVGNEMYFEGNKGLNQEALCQLIYDEVACLAKKAENLVVVSNEFATEDESYDEETRQYIQLVHLVNEKLKELSQVVYIKRKEEWQIEKNI